MLEQGIDIHGIAHITGEDLLKIFLVSCHRILMQKYKNSWPMIPIFSYMQKIGNIPEQDMYRTFNMGIGLILIVSKEEKKK